MKSEIPKTSADTRPITALHPVTSVYLQINLRQLAPFSQVAELSSVSGLSGCGPDVTEIEFHLFFGSGPIIRLLFSRLGADFGNWYFGFSLEE